MKINLGFHIHGYQTGDIVRRLDTDPRKKVSFVERFSPVSLKKNGTSARGYEAYNLTEAYFIRYSGILEQIKQLALKWNRPVCSFGLDPMTFNMILEHDIKHKTDLYSRIIEAMIKGYVDPVVTIPFHPIFPHVRYSEQRVLARSAFEFYKPILANCKLKQGRKLIVGFWLPECSWSLDSIQRIYAVFLDFMKSPEFEGREGVLYFLVDERQVCSCPSRVTVEEKIKARDNKYTNDAKDSSNNLPKAAGTTSNVKGMYKVKLDNGIVVPVFTIDPKISDAFTSVSHGMGSILNMVVSKTGIPACTPETTEKHLNGYCHTPEPAAAVRSENPQGIAEQVPALQDERGYDTGVLRSGTTTNNGKVGSNNHLNNNRNEKGLSGEKYIDDTYRPEDEFLVTVATELDSLCHEESSVSRLSSLVQPLSLMQVNHTLHSKWLEIKLEEDAQFLSGSRIEEVFLYENSTWADYGKISVQDVVGKPYPSDTRWTGMRRADSKVIHRMYNNSRISQIWKVAFTHTQYVVDKKVKRFVFDIIKLIMGDVEKRCIYNFLIDYQKIFFFSHFSFHHQDTEELSFRKMIEEDLRDSKDPDEGTAENGNAFCHYLMPSQVKKLTPEKVEALAYAARAYWTMLASQGSYARYPENIDNRAVFQNSVLMAHSYMDCLKAYLRLNQRMKADRVFREFTTDLIKFEDAYIRYSLDSLFGHTGWETLESAFFASIQSQVPDQCSYNVVKRAALYCALHDMPESACMINKLYEAKAISPITGHIQDELQADWRNTQFCEHDLKGEEVLEKGLNIEHELKPEPPVAPS